MKKQIGTLSQYDSLKEALKESNDLENQIWAQYIPAYINTRANACIHRTDMQREELVNIKDDEGEAVDFTAIKDAFKLAMKDVAEDNRKATIQWEEALNKHLFRQRKIIRLNKTPLLWPKKEDSA